MRAVLYCAISACTSGSSWMICSASAWRRARSAASRARRRVVGHAGLDLEPHRAPSALARAPPAASRAAPARAAFSRSTRSCQTGVAAARRARRTAACIASSRTIAADAAGRRRSALHQRAPSGRPSGACAAIAGARLGHRRAAATGVRDRRVGAASCGDVDPAAAARRVRVGAAPQRRPRGRSALRAGDCAAARGAAGADAGVGGATRAPRARLGGRERQHAQQHHHQAAVLVGRQAELGAAVQRRCCRAAGSRRPAAARRGGATSARRGRRRRAASGTACSTAICCSSAAISSSVPAADRPSARRPSTAAISAAPSRRRERLDAAHRMAAVDRAEHLAHARFVERAGAEGDRLVGERQRVAHRAARRAREQAQRARLGGDVLLREHRRRDAPAPSAAPSAAG